MPELHHLSLSSNREPVELRIEVLQNNYLCFGTFSGTFPQFFFLQCIDGLGVNKFGHFDIRLRFQLFFDQLQSTALLRQTLGEKEYFITREGFGSCHVAVIFHCKIIGVSLSRTVVIAADTVHRIVGTMLGLFFIFPFFQIIFHQKERQPHGTESELQQISFPGTGLRTGKLLFLDWERLIIQNPFLRSTPERKNQIHLVPRRRIENVRQLDLRIGHNLSSQIGILQPDFHRKTTVHLPLGEDGLNTNFTILHVIRQFAAKSQLHHLIIYIHCNSVVYFLHGLSLFCIVRVISFRYFDILYLNLPAFSSSFYFYKKKRIAFSGKYVRIKSIMQDNLVQFL